MFSQSDVIPSVNFSIPARIVQRLVDFIRTQGAGKHARTRCSYACICYFIRTRNAHLSFNKNESQFKPEIREISVSRNVSRSVSIVALHLWRAENIIFAILGIMPHSTRCFDLGAFWPESEFRRPGSKLQCYDIFDVSKSATRQSYNPLVCQLCWITTDFKVSPMQILVILFWFKLSHPESSRCTRPRGCKTLPTSTVRNRGRGKVTNPWLYFCVKHHRTQKKGPICEVSRP